MEREEKSGRQTGQGSVPPWKPMFLCWLVYTSAYLGRYSYQSNITAVIEAFGVTHGDAGLVTTCFFFAYGVGQVVNGILCRRYPKKWVIPLALAVSAALNLAVFAGAPFPVLKYLWLLNGAAQSVLWSSLILLLSQTLQKESLPKSVLVMSTTVPIGTFLIYGLSALFALGGGYRLSFLCGAAVMAASAVVWLALYRGTFSRDKSAEDAAEGTEAVRKKPDAALKAVVVILCLFAVANNLVKDGLTTWVPSILKERFGLPESLSILLTLVLPMLGMFGAACNTALEKKAGSFVTLTGLWYLGAAAAIGGVVVFAGSGAWAVVLAAFGLVSLCMHAVNNAITSMAPLYLREHFNSGLLAGVLNGCCYVGSTISSYGLGSVADRFGWNGVFLLLLGVSCVPILIAGGELFSRKRREK